MEHLTLTDEQKSGLREALVRRYDNPNTDPDYGPDLDDLIICWYLDGYPMDIFDHLKPTDREARTEKAMSDLRQLALAQHQMDFHPEGFATITSFYEAINESKGSIKH